MSSIDSKNNHKGTVLVYVVFLAIAVYIYKKIAAIFQCLAFSLLAVQVLAGNLSGISVKSLQLDAFALVCRLSTTTWLSGYIPADVTGDFLYQTFDGLSLAMAVWLIYRMRSARRSTDSPDDQDGLPAAPFAVVCFVLACLLHADLNESPLF